MLAYRPGYGEALTALLMAITLQRWLMLHNPTYLVAVIDLGAGTPNVLTGAGWVEGGKR